MNPPINFKSNIPLFYDKSSSEFRLDPYERYDEMVIRQIALHLADELWGYYPFQAVLDFVLENVQIKKTDKLVELGCGVGRLIGELAKRFPQVDCWGIDYSYQMLQQTRRYWINQQDLYLDRTERGFPIVQNKGFSLENLQLGLAKAEALPFGDNSLDLVCHSFLLDRLENPIQALEEQFRILKKGGRLIFISPLNFQKKQHWEALYPVDKLLKEIENLSFSVVSQQNIIIKEPLDIHGNYIEWKCVAFVLKK